MAKLSLEELQKVLEPRPRHPALVRRDAAYASASQHPRLTSDGKLRVSGMPLAVDLIGLRPLSIEEQVRRFTSHNVTDFNLIPDEKFLSEDDFHDYLDDLPDEGWSPYELAGFENQVRSYEYNRFHASPDVPDSDSSPSGTLPKEPSAKRAHNAGGAEGDSPEPAAKD